MPQLSWTSRKFLGLILLSLLLWEPGRVARGAEPAEPPVRELKFVYLDPATGAESPVDSPSPQWFAGAARLAVGRPYSQKVAEEEIASFSAQHGLLLREVRPEPVDDGVRVVYVFEKRPRAWTVRIIPTEGAPSVRATELMEKAVKLRRDGPGSSSAVSADRWAIVDYLRRDGYHFATAEARYQPVPNRAGYVDVTFEVDRGPKVIVGEIAFAGNQALSRGQLLRTMSTREDTWCTSRRFVREKLEADVENIKRRYLAAGYDDAKVEARPVLFDPETVRVTLDFREKEGRDVVTSVGVSGAKSVNYRPIRDRFLLLPAREYTAEEFGAALKWMEEQYRKAGFRADPRDKSVSVEKRDGRGRAVAAITFGKAVETVTVDVGLKQTPRGDVIEKVALAATGPLGEDELAALISALRPGELWSEEILLQDLAAISKACTGPARGYALTDQACGTSTQGHRAVLEFQKKGGYAHIRIDIEEGGLYFVEDVFFEGVEPVLEEHIRDRLRMRKGSAFNRRDLAADVEAVRLVHQEQGYADAKVREQVELVKPGEKVYFLKYVVEPGKLYYVDLIRPRGNDRTRPVVITREMAIMPEERYDVRKISESLRRLRNLRYFDQVEIAAVDSRREAPAGAGYKDLVVNVKEASTRRLFVGAGASSAAGVFADIGYEDSNFDASDLPESWSDFVSGNALTGGGQTLSIFLQPGTQVSQFGINWREPWLHERPVELDVSAGYFTRDWDDYTVTRLGAGVTLGKRFQPTLTGFVGLRAHNVNVDDVDRKAPPEIFDDEGSHNVIGLSAGVKRDTIDDRIFPTSGKKYTLMAELIGDPVFDAVKLIAEGRWFKTVYEADDGTRHVISLWGDVGSIVGADVPIFERFYGGGLGSVRGFATHGISPLDNSRFVDPKNPALGTFRAGDGYAVGGLFKIEGGAEYHFPIIKDTLRGLVFLDAGSVADSSLGIGEALSDLRVSTGVGVHFMIPQLGRVPIVMYLGFPLKKVSGDETEAFSFSIGVLLLP